MDTRTFTRLWLALLVAWAGALWCAGHYDLDLSRGHYLTDTVFSLGASVLLGALIYRWLASGLHSRLQEGRMSRGWKE